MMTDTLSQEDRAVAQQAEEALRASRQRSPDTSQRIAADAIAIDIAWYPRLGAAWFALTLAEQTQSILTWARMIEEA